MSGLIDDPLSGKTNSPSDHWHEMPEFVQVKQEPFAKIIVRVETEEDLRALSVALGQKLTSLTKSAWFPYRPHRSPDKKEWVHSDAD